MIKSRSSVREDISSISSSRYYYDEISHWWRKLTEVLAKHGYTPEGGCPTCYNNEGWALVRILSGGKPTGYCVRYSWYRMPVSGRWEVVNYVT